MYVVGQDDAGFHWRMEKRRLSDGALCTAANCGTQFGTGGVAIGDTATEVANAIAVDSTYLYVAGLTSGGTANDWRVEKRLLTTGALVSGFGTSGGADSGIGGTSGAQDIVIDSTYMYVVGADGSPDWRMEKRLLSNGNLCTAANCGTEFGTAGVVTSSVSGFADSARAVAIDGTYMYVAGNNSTPNFRIEKRLLTTGAVDSAFGTSGAVTGVTASEEAFGITIDGTYLYVAGYNTTPDWRIERRLISNGNLAP
jgi:hypothetical protein